MQTTGLASSLPASTRSNATNNYAAEKAHAAANFSDAMHRALTDVGAKPNRQTNSHSHATDETVGRQKNSSVEIRDDKKRARAKRNSEHTSESTAAQFLGMAGVPTAIPQRAGNAHDSNEAKGSVTPISDDSTKSDTVDASTDDIEAADQSAEATNSSDTPAAENQISAESPEHGPSASSTATQELAAQAIEPNSEAVNPAEVADSADLDPPNAEQTDSKTPVAQAGASRPDPHGTSAAKQDITMKKAAKTPKVAGPAEQELPGIATDSSKELPKGQKLSLKEDAQGSEKLEMAGIEMPLRVLTSSDSSAPTVTAAATTSSPLDARILERTHDIVALHAMRAGEYTSNSLHVMVKPGAGIQLSLELRQSARGIEVHASLHKGDFEQLNQHWADLQQRLEARGIRVGALTTAENFSSTSHQQFDQSKQQSPDQDPLYAGAFAEFALAGSMTEAPAARAARASAYRGWETWA
jgi:hypothetical protein